VGVYKIQNFKKWGTCPPVHPVIDAHATFLSIAQAYLIMEIQRHPNAHLKMYLNGTCRYSTCVS